MNDQDAKFVLGAYRSNGKDADDPAFAETLAKAGRDPELQAWLERQGRFDQAVTAKLQSVVPPAGLRDAILASGRAGQPRSNWWKSAIMLGAAAAIVVLGILSYSVLPMLGRPAVSDLIGFAISDLANAHDDHEDFPPSLASLQGQLASAKLPLTTTLSIDLAELRSKRCRVLRVGRREVFEVCFNRDGIWYHVYVAKRSDFAPGKLDSRALITTNGAYVATAWADAKNIYTLVAEGAPAILQGVL